MSYRTLALLFRVNTYGCIGLAGICAYQGSGKCAALFMMLSFAVHELALSATKCAVQKEQGR